MKRAVAVLLLALLGTHLVGSYVYFALRAAAIKREMRAALQQTPAEDLEVLILSQSEYTAARENDDEVKWQGRMYDVARVVAEEDRIIVYALHDEAEDSLLAFLDAVLKNSARDKKPVPGSLMSWLALKWLPESSLFMPAQVVVFKGDSEYQFMMSEIHTSILSPPPRS